MPANFTTQTGKLWKDYGSGTLMLTLSSLHAGVLQAVIPIFISLVGPLTWIVIKYIWYQCSVRRKSRPKYDLYRAQGELLLRNSSGDLGMFFDAASLAWKWKKYGHKAALTRRLPLMVISFLFFWIWQGVAVVSLFIWQYKVPGIVLIQGSICGNNSLFNPLFFTQDGELPDIRIGLSETILAETYVTQCYNSESVSSQCNVYASQSLAVTGFNSSCPFGNLADGFCVSTNSTPYMLSSGPINSHIDLGINAPVGNRVTYQKNTTCSPLHNQEFAQDVNANQTDEIDLWPIGTRLQWYYYGPVADSNRSWTFEYNQAAPDDGGIYDITGETYTPVIAGNNSLYAWIPNSTWTNRTDADVTILFHTQNHIIYKDYVYDPFFLASNPENKFNETINGVYAEYITPEFFVNTMGCIDQHQICNPSIDPSFGCTTFMAYNQLLPALGNLRMNSAQLATARRIISNLGQTNTFNSINGRRGAAILASQTVDGVLQTEQLPVNQWRIEMTNWFSVSLAKLQQGIIDFAAGPLNADLLPYIQYPSDEESRHMCDSQQIPITSDYANFNMTAIFIVLGLGVFIILACLFFERVMQRWCFGSRGHRRWIEDGPFQLQRLELQRRGMNGWDDLGDDIPISKEPFPNSSAIPLANGNHMPIIVRPPAAPLVAARPSQPSTTSATTVAPGSGAAQPTATQPSVSG